MPEYYPAENQLITEIEVKHSRFITHVMRTPTLGDSDAILHNIREEHKKANHNCWARICGPRTELAAWGCSDDGEPKGTAGRPMLNVLEHSDWCELTVVVTRYFGGIKLGTGGIARAYSQATQEALALLTPKERVTQYPFTLCVPHPQVGDIEQLLSRLQLSILQRDWTDSLLIHGQGSAKQLNALKIAITPWQHQVSYSDESDIC